MGQFFTKDYTGDAVSVFSPSHLTALGLVLLVNLSWSMADKATPKAAALSLWTGGGADRGAILALCGNWTTGSGRSRRCSAALCSLFVFLSALMLVTKSYAIYEYAYFLGIAGAMQALLTPDAGIYGFPHFRFFQVILSHGSIVTAAVYMTVVEGCRPTWRSLRRVAVWGNVYLIGVGILNALLGSNYLFIAHKPETASLLDVLPPWPWYILYMEGLGAVLFMLLYLPFALRDWRARVTAEQA
jgi:hypothetical integral membrane protein (TIGR02206 family)